MRPAGGTTLLRYCFATQPPDVRNSLPRPFGSYTLLSRLGEGTTGVVYKASRSTDGKYVALKIYRREDSSEDAVKRHFRGTQLASQLDHPHIVRIHDYGEVDRSFFVASELLEGSDLKSVLPMSREIRLRSKCRWMIQLCEALAYAHQQGVIHRDMKPANVFVCNSGDLVLTDFGIARKSESDITRSGTIVGTPDYFSPEQILMVRPDPKSDIFSLGIVFYELWTGVHPFRADTLSATVHRILNETPVPAHEANPDVPIEMDPIFRKLLHRDPKLRYASCNEVAADLEKLCKKIDPHWKDASHQESTPGRSTDASTRYSLWLLILILFSFAILILILILLT